MKAEEKSSMPRVRIAVIGDTNVGKSGKTNNLFVLSNAKPTTRLQSKKRQISTLIIDL